MMPKRAKVEALVLSRRSVGEADRLVTFFTREYGLLRVLAKGVRKIPSRRGGHLEPLTRVWAVIQGKPGHYFLSGVETLDDYDQLKSDPAAKEQLKVLCHLLIRVLPEEEEQSQLYRRLVRVCGALPRLSARSRWLTEAGVWCEILTAAGLMPRLDSCAHCSRRDPSEAVVLNGGVGGWNCLSCHGSFSGAHYSIPPQGLVVLRWLARDPRRVLRADLPMELARQLRRAARVYAAEMLGTPLPLGEEMVYA